MKGKRSPKSWEKQAIYLLDNGFEVTVEWNLSYGEYVTRIDSPDKKTYWCACDGYMGHEKLPPEIEFARDWIKSIKPHGTLMRPDFEKY